MKLLKIKNIKIFFICAIAIFISNNVFAETKFTVQSTVTEDNAQEVIRLDVLPVIKTNYSKQPRKVDGNSVYIAPLIEPAKTEKPTLNFNLNNIKNIKQGAILPNDNVSQSITSVMQYFNASYDKIFSHILSILEENELEVVSFDTKSGRIFANYKNEKPIYITISQYNEENVLVKITPADGIYNIPARLTNGIFTDINKIIGAK